jgi:hypothetical protein
VSLIACYLRLLHEIGVGGSLFILLDIIRVVAKSIY